MAAGTSDILLKYFQDSAEELEVKARKAGVFDNKSDIGTVREDILLNFLRRHLPDRCVPIKGGYLFDSEGQRSRQLDIIITNDLTLQFQEDVTQYSQKSFSCIEGSYAAISVKSILNEKELLDSIENLRSIPPMPKIILNPYLKTKGLENRLPFKVIFGFKGISCLNTVEHLMEASKRLSLRQFPDLIIVNKDYYVWKVPNDDMAKIPDAEIKAGSLVALRDSKLVGGLALLQLITEIQKISNIGSHMVINFSNYMGAARQAAKNAGEDPAFYAVLNE